MIVSEQLVTASCHSGLSEIAALRGEMLRMEQVLDARLKHLEEYFQR